MENPDVRRTCVASSNPGRVRTPAGVVRLALILPLGLLAWACGDDDGTGPDPEPTDPTPTVVSVEPAEATLKAIGDTLPLAAEVRDGEGEPMPDEAVEWRSLDTARVTVDPAGAAVAVAAGSAEVVAAAGAAADTAALAVDPVGRHVAIEPSDPVLHAIGDTAALEVEVRDPNGNPLEDESVAWTSLDEAVATVDSAGRVVAAREGTARIQAAAAEGYDEVSVTVRQVAVSLNLNIDVDTLAEGETLALDATVVDSNDVAIDDPDLTWTSSDPDVATVDATGLVTAVRGEAVARVGVASGSAVASAEIAVLGRIAFFRVDTASVDPVLAIGLLNADGSGVESITDPSVDARQPAWSPDGQRIVFVGPAEFNTDIYVMDADGDGTDAVPLTDDPARDVQPAWSPDGTEIAFVSRRDDGKGDIFVVAADGGGSPRQVTDDGADAWTDREPTWSPDGTRIAFESDRGGDGDYDIWVVDADGGAAPQRLIATAAGEGYPSWSPDGDRIAFAANYDGAIGLFVADLDGGGAPLRLTTAEDLDVHASWSPDGTRIVFERQRLDDSRALYMVDADGSSAPRLVVDDDAFDARRPAWRP